jgi:hypothetical protein
MKEMARVGGVGRHLRSHSFSSIRLILPVLRFWRSRMH